MLTYVCLGTNDLKSAIRFYDATLGTLGLKRCVTNDPEWDRIQAGWGTYENGGQRQLAVWVGEPFDQNKATSENGTLVGFKARSWKEVEDF